MLAFFSEVKEDNKAYGRLCAPCAPLGIVMVSGLEKMRRRMARHYA